MAHGPCGEDFKSAFTCFVRSEEDPKGSDCVDLFRAMQECFKKHPDIYENDDDDDDDEPEVGAEIYDDDENTGAGATGTRVASNEKSEER